MERRFIKIFTLISSTILVIVVLFIIFFICRWYTERKKCLKNVEILKLKKFRSSMSSNDQLVLANYEYECDEASCTR
jgi:hypothetical protein